MTNKEFKYPIGMRYEGYITEYEVVDHRTTYNSKNEVVNQDYEVREYLGGFGLRVLVQTERQIEYCMTHYN